MGWDWRTRILTKLKMKVNFPFKHSNRISNKVLVRILCSVQNFFKLGYIKRFCRSLSLNGEHYWCVTGNMTKFNDHIMRITYHPRLKLSFLSIDVCFLEIRKNVLRKRHETGNSKNSFLSFTLNQHKSFVLFQTSTCVSCPHACITKKN